MTLRADIHDAYDEIEPALPPVIDRVIRTAMRAERAGRPRTVRLRAPLSLIAALVAVALVVAALIGGRVVADWRTFVGPHTVNPVLTPLQKLEARPLRFAVDPTLKHCPDGPYDANGDLGNGPIHVSGGAVETKTAWGSYLHNFLWADGPIQGPILLRAVDLITGAPIVFVGQFAAGPAIGMDVLDGQVVDQHTEVVIQNPASPYGWTFVAGTARPDDCGRWQVDGPTFSEDFG